jgi:hypothetical protein
MALIFDPTVDIDTAEEPVFSAVFLSQQSYINILDLVDIYFKLGMRTEGSTLECLPQSYMFITYKKDKIKMGIGKSVILKLTGLGYSPKLHTVVAYVQLKRNFTDNVMPHIIISKPRNLKRADIRKLLKDPSFQTHLLHAPYTVHGKIGVMSGSKEETASIMYSTDGSPVQISNTSVTRPEVTLSVENSPPPGGAACSASTEEEETYMGFKVYKGSRGGKYIYYEQGKKRYLTDEFLAHSKEKAAKKGVFYNINFLADNS